jgi:DUF4097 and DUF4098 domain-containing protein YvlB
MFRSSKLATHAFIAFIAAAPLGCAAGHFSDAVKAEDKVSRTFKTQATPHLVVETFNGDVTVTVGQAGVVQATVHKWSTGSTREAADLGLVDIETDLAQDADAIHIKAELAAQDIMGSRGAAVELQVPEGAVLDLRTNNGKIVATGKIGDLAGKTSNGPIEVREAAGKLQLSTANGKIAINGGSGKLQLRTNNGSVDIKSDKAIVDAQTDNGTITFTGSLATGDYNFQNRNGKVSLTLPAGAHFRLDAETKNGKVDSDFPVKATDKNARSKGKNKKPRANKLQGVVGDDSPGTTIKVRVSNGSVEIRRER